MPEQVIALSPFTVRRVARWRDCDPAGVVYAGNFPEYLLDATSHLRRHLFALSWDEVRRTTGVDTPAKAMSLVFCSSLWPDDVFDVEVYVGEIRQRTMDFLARARRADDGCDVFLGRLSTVTVAATDRRIAVDIPDVLKDAARRHRDIHPPPTELLQARW